MNEEKLREALAKARFQTSKCWRKKFGRWEVSIYYRRDHGWVFSARVTRKDKPSIERSFPISKEHTETRSKSMWFSDQTWRLKESGVGLIANCVIGAANKLAELEARDPTR